MQFVKRFLHIWNERKDVFAHLYYYCVAKIASMYNCIISPLFSCFYLLGKKTCLGVMGLVTLLQGSKDLLVPISLQFLNQFVWSKSKTVEIKITNNILTLKGNTTQREQIAMREYCEEENPIFTFPISQYSHCRKLQKLVKLQQNDGIFHVHTL